MRKVQQTSLMAFCGLKRDGLLAFRQKLVLDFIKENPDSSDKEISIGLNLPINCITPRRNELAKAGLIIRNGTKEQAGRQVACWLAN